MKANIHGKAARQLLCAALAAGGGMALLGLTGAGAAIAEPAAAAWPLADWLDPDLARALEAHVAHAVRLIQAGFAREPAVMLAITGAAAVPLIAIGAGLSRAARRRNARTARRRRRAGPRTASERAPGGAAWIELESRRGRSRPLAIGELTRIGRSDDCDLAVADHRLDPMHALIRRTPDCEFIIIDVSANGGAGIAVNGHRLRQGRLRDGDRIELGGAHVVFHQGQPGVRSQPAATP